MGNQIRNLRIASVVEAVSYLPLLVATVVKQAGGAETGVSVLGPIHGVLYLIFAAMVMATKETLGWDWMKTFSALLIGSLPLGGFWLERKWLAPVDTTVAQPA